MNEGGTRWDWGWLIVLNITQTGLLLMCLVCLMKISGG